MNTFFKFFLILSIALSASTISASAQKKRADKTSSAKAYYGQSPAKPNMKNHYAKQKKGKKIKSARSQSAKRATAHSRNRRKFS